MDARLKKAPDAFGCTFNKSQTIFTVVNTWLFFSFSWLRRFSHFSIRGAFHVVELSLSNCLLSRSVRYRGYEDCASVQGEAYDRRNCMSYQARLVLKRFWLWWDEWANCSSHSLHVDSREWSVQRIWEDDGMQLIYGRHYPRGSRSGRFSVSSGEFSVSFSECPLSESSRFSFYSDSSEEIPSPTPWRSLDCISNFKCDKACPVASVLFFRNGCGFVPFLPSFVLIGNLSMEMRGRPLSSTTSASHGKAQAKQWGRGRVNGEWAFLRSSLFSRGRQ